jgi:hypothetical protein
LIFSAVASSTLAFVWSLLCHAALPIIVVAFHTSIANAPVHRSFASWCRQRCGWNLARRDLRSHEGIVSGCEVNWLIDGLCGERLPAIDFAQVDLA